MKFSSVEEAILRTYAGKSPALRSCRTHLSCERPPPFAHIEQRQHGVGAVGVLGQSAIARLGKTPQALEGQERMLDLGAHRGFSTIGYLFCFDASPGRGFARGSSSTLVPRSAWRRRWCPRRASCHWPAAALPPWQ